MRAEVRQPSGPAFSFGIYDPTARRGLARNFWAAADAPTGGYGAIELPPVRIPPGSFLWLAPRDNEASVTAIWVDRIEPYPESEGEPPASKEPP